MLDPVQKRVLTSVSCASDASETVLLRDEAVCTLLGVDELVTLRPEQEAGWSERTPPYTTVPVSYTHLRPPRRDNCC